MKLYKLEIDMLLIISRLKDFRLKEYNSNRATVFVEAADPDDACYKAFYNLSLIVLSQNKSVETAILLRDLKNDFKIIKVHNPE